MKKIIYILLVLIPFFDLFAVDCIKLKPTEINNHFILVVDKSGSMSGEPIKHIKSALNNFVNDMKNNDKISLVLFDNQVRVTNVYTSNKQQIYNSINKIHADGGTALYDALGKASVLAHENGSQSIIIFFTDGYDNSSRLSIKNVKSIALSQGIYVYGIGLGDINQEALTNVARKTNGDFLHANNSNQLSDLYNKVLSNYYDIFDRTKINSSRIVIKSQPVSQSVYLNGNLLKHKTPIVVENLKPGFYEIVVKFKRGDWKCSTEIDPGYTGKINARENELGRDLVVISDVKSAMVFLDDNFVGYTSKYPFVSKTVKTGWFSKTKNFNFNKQLVIENISTGNHKIKIVGLEDVDNFFQPLGKEIYVNKKDIIINAEFLNNKIHSKETKKTIRDYMTNTPYDKVDNMFDELE